MTHDQTPPGETPPPEGLWPEELANEHAGLDGFLESVRLVYHAKKYQQSQLQLSVVWDALAKNLNRAASIPRVFVHQDAEPLLSRVAPETVLEIVRTTLGLPLQRSLDM